MDRSSFERAADPRFDFVPSWLQRWSALRDPLGWAWERYAQARIPQELQRLCRDLAASGVRVEAAVTREQLGDCLRERRVVMLIAHFALRPFETDCIVNPYHVLAMVDNEDHWVLSAARQALRGRLWWRFVAPGEQGLRRTIAGRFNRLVARGERAGGPRRSRESVSRLMLEYALMPALRAGQPLELADGMVSAWDLIEDLIPDDRELVIDLTACNAVEMAEVVRLLRRGCRVVAPDGEIGVEAGILLTRTVTGLLRSGHRNYFEAHLEALALIRDVIEQETNHELEKAADRIPHGCIGHEDPVARRDRETAGQ